MARVNLPFVVMGGLIVGLASGCAAPGRRIESGAEKLSCTELLALMVDLPESWPESPPETMRIGELLQREIVARGGEAFFDGLCDVLCARADFVDIRSAVAMARLDAIARDVGGAAGERARFLMLTVGVCPDWFFGEGFLPSTLAIASKYATVPLEDIVGEPRAERITSLKDEYVEEELRSARADPLASAKRPEIAPLDHFAGLTETVRPAMAPDARLSPYEWLWLYWNLTEDSPLKLEVGSSLPRLLSDVPGIEIGEAVIRLLCAPDTYQDLTKGAFWERVEAILRVRSSEACERARYVLLLAGDVFTNHSPLRHNDERRALLEKYHDVRLVELVGETGLSAIQDRAVDNWFSPYGEQPMAIECLSRMLDTASRERLLASYHAKSPFTSDHVVINASIARVEGDRGLDYLEKKAREDELWPDPSAVYALVYWPARAALPVLRRLHRKDFDRRDVIWTLERLDYSDVAPEEMRFVHELVDDLLSRYESKEHEEALLFAGRLLGALGEESCDRLLKLTSGFRTDLLRVVDGGIDTPPVYAEDGIVDALGKACGARAAPELLRLLHHEEGAVRFAVLRALGSVEPGVHVAEVLPFLDDPEPSVQLEAASYLSKVAPGELTGPAREKAVEILREAFSLEHPIEQTFHYTAWEPYEFEQFERAARAYHRLAPQEALDAFRTILGSLRPTVRFTFAHEEPPPAPDAEERGPDPFDESVTWPLLLPLFIELSGIDWDRPFPLEHLGVSDEDSAPVVLPELERRLQSVRER